MLVYTWSEIENTKLGEVDNKAYHRIYGNIARNLGFMLADRIIQKMWNRSLRELLDASGINCLEGFQII
jgi:hypothetical protein